MKWELLWSEPAGRHPSVSKEFRQVVWDEALEYECREIVRLGVREDLGRTYDWTTVALVPGTARGRAEVVARQSGVIAGLEAARVAIDELECGITWTAHLRDGDAALAKAPIAEMTGSARDLLTAERLLLNLLGHLSGIATLTRQFVDAVKHTQASIYDTRKTTPGWRGLEKYAVGCGGGKNHRRGLCDAVLIKDNHLALRATADPPRAVTPAQAVEQARQFVKDAVAGDAASEMIIEVEVDSLEQLDQVLAAEPDIVLLDNMSPDQLREAVRRRDQCGGSTQLEASGRVDLGTVAAIAESGVERISVGAITHSAPCLDVGLDWRG